MTDNTDPRLDDRQRRVEAERKAGFAEDVAREMRHRLKNQLAVVGSVSKLLARHTDDAKELVQKLEEKLIALSHAQDLLTVHRDDPITSRDAIDQVLAASGAGDHIECLDIPDVTLGHDAVQQLALILNELQTNSLKYGSLRDETGRITLSGSREGRSLSLVWHEDCDRPIEEPERHGAGTQLITRLGSTNDAAASFEWHPRAVTVTFHLRTLD